MKDRSPALSVVSDVEGRRQALGAAIRGARAERTQAELGQILGGLAQATISAWENGAVDLTCEQLRSVEVGLGLRLGELTRAAGYFSPQEDDDHGEQAIEQELICSLFLSSVEDAVEAVQAADVLGLGVKVHNRWLREDVDTRLGEWVVDLFVDGLDVPG